MAGILGNLFQPGGGGILGGGPLFGANGQLAQFRQQNPAQWMNMAAGLMSGPSLGQGMARAAAGMALGQPADIAAQERAKRIAAIGGLIDEQKAAGVAIPPATQKLFSAYPELAEKFALSQMMPGEPKAPTVETFYENGLPVKKQWNGSGWETIGGPKAPDGTSLTVNPDGTVSFEQGVGVGVKAGNQALGRTTSNDIQKDIDNLTIQRDQVERIGKLYDPELLTYWGKARGLWASGADKLGMAGPEDKAFLDKQTRFVQNVEQAFNQYRKDITGAAAAVAELERLKKAVINTDQGPTQFEAALGEFARALDRGLGIKTQLLREGIPLGTPQFSAEFERRFLSGAGSGGAPAATGPAPIYTSPSGARVFAE